MEQPGQWLLYKRHTALDKPHYLFEIDEYRRGEEQFLLAHLRVHKFSPAILKAIRADWHTFRECVDAPLFVAPHDQTGREVDTEKWTRFVSLLGFKPLCDVLWAGKPMRLFLHHKDFHGHVFSHQEHQQ